MESVCVGQWPLGTEPSLEYIWCSQWYTVGQTDFSLFQQVSITNISLVGGGTFDPPPLLWDFAWSEPMRILCVLSQALVVPMCIGPTGSGKHCFLGGHPSSLALTISRLSLLCSSLSPEGRGLTWWRCLIRNECSEVSHSVWCPAVGLCIKYHLLQEKVL